MTYITLKGPLFPLPYPEKRPLRPRLHVHPLRAVRGCSLPSLLPLVVTPPPCRAQKGRTIGRTTRTDAAPRWETRHYIIESLHPYMLTHLKHLQVCLSRYSMLRSKYMGWFWDFHRNLLTWKEDLPCILRQLGRRATEANSSSCLRAGGARSNGEGLEGGREGGRERPRERYRRREEEGALLLTLVRPHHHLRRRRRRRRG